MDFTAALQGASPLLLGLSRDFLSGQRGGVGAAQQALAGMQAKQAQEAKRQQALEALRAAGINVPGSAPSGGTPGILPPGGSPMPSGGLGAAPVGGAPQTGLGLPPGANPALLAAYGAMDPDGLLSTLVEAQLNPKAPPAGPTSVEEFRFAQSQGFKGGYEDFLRQKASWSRAPGTSVKIVNEGSIPAGYEIERDEEGRPLRMRPIPGSPGYVDAVDLANKGIMTADQAIQNIDALINDPRLPNATGWGAYNPIDIPGFNAETRARMEQIQGEAFLQAYERLKGAGPVTEVEGLKGEQAIARLKAAQRPEDYIMALRDLRDVVVSMRNSAQRRLQTSTGRTPANVPPLTATEQADEELMRALGLE